MKTIVLDFSQLLFLIAMISITAWVWMRSLATCPKSFSDEYIVLHKKYNHIVEERDKMKDALIYIQQNLSQQQNMMQQQVQQQMQQAQQQPAQQVFY